MYKQKIVVLQNDINMAERLASQLVSTGEYDVVGVFDDGEQGCSAVIESKPDIVIIDLVLRRSDGFSALERLSKSGLRLKKLVLSAIVHDDFVQKAMMMGADYYLVKPCEFDTVLDRLHDLSVQLASPRDYANQEKNISLEKSISGLFLACGIPPHIQGYRYLRSSVKMVVDTPSIINNITRELYPKIGKMYDTTPSKVERAIRHAISVAWSKGRFETLNSFFGVRAYDGGERPTNGEFIALVADRMILDRAK